MLVKTHFDAYVCPECSSNVHWSCHGREGHAHCSKSPTATRIFIPGDPLVFCEWTGICRRRADGKVEIFYVEEL